MDRDVKKYNTETEKYKDVNCGLLSDNVTLGKNKDVENYKKNKRAKRKVIIAAAGVAFCCTLLGGLLKVKADENKKFNEQKIKILQMTELPLEERYIKILNTLNCGEVESAKIKEELGAKGYSVVETVDEQKSVTYSLKRR